jgi:hypothetical protein
VLDLFPEANGLLRKALVFIPVNYSECCVPESLDPGGIIIFFYPDLHLPAMCKFVNV